MKRFDWLAWITAAIALAGSIAGVALSPPWSWLAMVGTVVVIALLMQRMMAEYERRARMPRGRRK